MSQNKGQTWWFLGEIITPRVSVDVWRTKVCTRYFWDFDIGTGNFAIIRDPPVTGDDYFYVYFRDYLDPGPPPIEGWTVARAKVLDVYNAALQWRAAPFAKYCPFCGDADQWQQHGIGGYSNQLVPGKCEDIEGSPCWEIEWDIKYNSYLHQYLVVSGSQAFSHPGVQLAASYDGINWSPRFRLTDSLGPPPYPSLVNYPSLIGTGDDPNVLGQTFYLYAAKGTDSLPSETNLSVTRYKVDLAIPTDQCPPP